jgi:hypothetical protein
MNTKAKNTTNTIKMISAEGSCLLQKTLQICQPRSRALFMRNFRAHVTQVMLTLILALLLT